MLASRNRNKMTFSHFSISTIVAKHPKTEGGPFGEKQFFRKKSHNAEKN